ncbi:MAG: archease [Candidatus Omnitrophota bacterium]
MQKKDYEIIEHTADIGIRVSAPDLAGVFSKAAAAMFDIIAEKKLSAVSRQLSAKKVIVKQKAGNLEELLVNWLNELLSLSAVKELIFYGFKINKLDAKGLEAEVFAKPMKNFKVNTEIKAATYHELKVIKVDSGWQAEVIFDV